MGTNEELARKQLEEKDRLHGKNQDEVEDFNKKKIIEKDGKRILLENSEVMGVKSKEYSFGNREGWIEIPKDELPSKGMFYPDNAIIYIKSADVGEIKHWSTIDESSFLDIDSKMNYVLERCMNFVNNETKTPYLWKDVLEIDRLFIIFRISELSLPGDLNKLQMTFSCDATCKAPRSEMGQYRKKVILKSKTLNLLELDSYLLKLYNPEEKCFIKNTKDGEKLKFYLPSTGVSSRIKSFLVDMREQGKPLDTFVVKLMPYIINDYNDVTDKYMNDMALKIMGWGKNKVLFVNGVVEKIEKSVKMVAFHECEKCSTVLEVPLFFRGEPKIKDFFIVSDELDELV